MRLHMHLSKHTATMHSEELGHVNKVLEQVRNLMNDALGVPQDEERDLGRSRRDGDLLERYSEQLLQLVREKLRTPA